MLAAGAFARSRSASATWRSVVSRWYSAWCAPHAILDLAVFLPAFSKLLKFGLLLLLESLDAGHGGLEHTAWILGVADSCFKAFDEPEHIHALADDVRGSGVGEDEFADIPLA